MRPQNTISVKQLSKITSMAYTVYCIARPGGTCIYGTDVVLPVAEGLRMKNLLEGQDFKKKLKRTAELTASPSSLENKRETLTPKGECCHGHVKNENFKVHFWVHKVPPNSFQRHFLLYGTSK